MWSAHEIQQEQPTKTIFKWYKDYKVDLAQTKRHMYMLGCLYMSNTCVKSKLGWRSSGSIFFFIFLLLLLWTKRFAHPKKKGKKLVDFGHAQLLCVVMWNWRASGGTDHLFYTFIVYISGSNQITELWIFGDKEQYLTIYHVLPNDLENLKWRDNEQIKLTWESL